MSQKLFFGVMFVTFLLAVPGAHAFPGYQQNSTEKNEQPAQAPMDPVLAEAGFKETAGKINTDPVNALAVLNNGRIKPLQSLARENILYITGSSGKWGLSPLQIYLGLAISATAPDVQLINVRSPVLREKLGFTKDKRFFSLRELATSQLPALAEPLVSNEQQNSRSMSQEDKDIIEVYNQMWLTEQISTGAHLARAVDIANNTQPPVIGEMATAWLQALAKSPQTAGEPLASQLLTAARAQSVPVLFQRQLGNLDLEVMYNRVRPFLISAIIFLLLGAALLFPPARNFFSTGRLLAIFAIPFLLQVGGFSARVYITGFAPVTNMYGTMLWVSLGVGLFAGLLFVLYRNFVLTGLLWMGSAAILLLTESIPLVLSPDMDPIVAVLRSNFWLTIHVLTITISYAAFTIVMLIGNVALVRSILHMESRKFYEEYALYAYRMIQLGVFLLTAGIILGGVWADYSWGRFWGWDPKETWALIADLGFLAILHARYIGWLDAFGLLAASPFAYLLVVMAWYGVNFILASGLHSYGFSSGGAMAVGAFVGLQVLLLIVAALMRARRMQTQTS